MASSSFLSLPLIIIFFTSQFLVSVNADAHLIEKTCERVKEKPFCVTVLESNQKSFKADVPGLSYIAGLQTYYNATSAGLYLAGMWHNASISHDDKVVLATDKCLRLAHKVVDALQRALNDSESKEYARAVTELKALVQEPAKFYDIFKDYGVEMPKELHEQIGLVSNLISLSLDLAQLLVGENGL